MLYTVSEMSVLMDVQDHTLRNWLIYQNAPHGKDASIIAGSMGRISLVGSGRCANQPGRAEEILLMMRHIACDATEW
jgi:hypothetical protein